MVGVDNLFALREELVELAGLFCCFVVLFWRWEGVVANHRNQVKLDSPTFEKKEDGLKRDEAKPRDWEDEWALVQQKEKEEERKKRRLWEKKMMIVDDVLRLTFPMAVALASWILEGAFCYYFVSLSCWSGRFDFLIRSAAVSVWILFTPPDTSPPRMLVRGATGGLLGFSLALFFLGGIIPALFVLSLIIPLQMKANLRHYELQTKPKFYGFLCASIAMFGLVFVPYFGGENAESDLFLCRILGALGLTFFFTSGLDLVNEDSFFALFLILQWALTSYFFGGWHFISSGAVLVLGCFPICAILLERHLRPSEASYDIICCLACCLGLSFCFFGLEGIIEGPRVSFWILLFVLIFPSMVCASESYDCLRRRDSIVFFHLVAVPFWMSVLWGLFTKGEVWGGVGGVWEGAREFGVVLFFVWWGLFFHLSILTGFQLLHPVQTAFVGLGVVLSLVGLMGGFKEFFGFFVVWLVEAVVWAGVYYDEVVVPQRKKEKELESKEKKMLWMASFSMKGSRRRR